MKVVDLMNRNVVTCHPSETLTTLINKFELFHIAGMPVVVKGRIVGIICQSDVLKRIKEGVLSELTVKDAMVCEVITAPPTESVVALARLMIEKNINRVPILENDKVIGIVTRGDIIKAVAECG
jgi:CBS domain-containing protein